MEETEKLRKLILERTGMSRSELDRLVEKKIKEFAGLLTELGALYTVAKELGLDIDIDRSLGLRKKISELKPGERGVSIIGRVTKLVPPRKTKKNGREIKYASVYLYDGTGEIRLVLWGRDADLVGDKITRGTIVEVINGRVDEFRGRKSISLGYDGRILINPPLEGEEIPEKPSFKVKDLSPGMKEVEVELEVIRSFPVRETTVNGETIRYGGFVGKDDTGTVRVVLWRDSAIEIPVGSRVRVFGDVKEGRNGVEIHVGRGGYVEILEEASTTFKDVKDLEEGQNVRLFGTIVDLLSKKPYTGKCNVCGGDVTWKEGKFVCSQCGSEDVTVTPILVLILDDGTGAIKLVFFGEKALEIYGDTFPSEASLDRGREWIGRDVIVSGTTRRSKVTGTLDVIVKEFGEPEFYEIYDVLLRNVERRLERLEEKDDASE